MRPAERSAGLALVLDDEREEAADWRAHHSTPNAQTRMRLFDRYQDFARAIARQEWRLLGNNALDAGDAEQLAYEALLMSIDRFDPGRGAKFKGYVRMRLKGAIRNALSKTSETNAVYSARRRAERDRMSSAKEAVNSSDPLTALRELATQIAIGFMLEDLGAAGFDELASDDPSAYDRAAWAQMMSELDKRLDGLPERERAVLDCHYRKGLQFREVAAMLGVTKGRVSQLHGQALQRLRKQLGKYR